MPNGIEERFSEAFKKDFNAVNNYYVQDISRGVWQHYESGLIKSVKT